MRSTVFHLAIAGTALFGVSAASADIAPGEYLMVVDSTNERLVLFDSYDGSLVEENFLDISGALPDELNSFTPKHAIQVDDEIWVTDQPEDRVDRFSIDGEYLGSVGGELGGLSNVRGMSYIDGLVHVANAGSGNNAPGESIVQIDPQSSQIVSSFQVDGSPWMPLATDDGMFVSFSGSETRIEEYSTTGQSLGIFHEGGDADGFQQIAHASEGGLWAASFFGDLSTRGIYRYDDDGNQVDFFDPGFPRGVHELGNGDVMWTDFIGVDVLDPATGESTLIFDDGSFQFIDTLVLPSPGALAALGIAGLVGRGRRRR